MLEKPHHPAADATHRCLRRGQYRPPLPEAQSALSRWMLCGEVAVISLLSALLCSLAYTPPSDNAPIKIASAPSMISPIAPGSIATAIFSSSDGADPAKGQVLYMQTCTSCHGQAAQGLPHMGVNLRASKFVSQLNDRKLVAFLKSGRRPTDPKNITGLLMPPRGGNVALDDDSLADIVAFLRQLQKEQRDQDAGVTPPPTSRPVAQNMLDLITGAP